MEKSLEDKNPVLRLLKDLGEFRLVYLKGHDFSEPDLIEAVRWLKEYREEGRFWSILSEILGCQPISSTFVQFLRNEIEVPETTIKTWTLSNYRSPHGRTYIDSCFMTSQHLHPFFDPIWLEGLYIRPVFGVTEWSEEITRVVVIGREGVKRLRSKIPGDLRKVRIRKDRILGVFSPMSSDYFYMELLKGNIPCYKISNEKVLLWRKNT